MLNMIPMEIIHRYPNLKDKFIGGDILQAVKWKNLKKKIYIYNIRRFKLFLNLLII